MTLAAIESASSGLASSQPIADMVRELRDALAATIPDVAQSACSVGSGSHTAEELLAPLDLELAHLGPATPIAKQSSGLAHRTTLMVARRLMEATPATLLLPDEPERSLDPHAQRAAMAGPEIGRRAGARRHPLLQRASGCGYPVPLRASPARAALCAPCARRLIQPQDAERLRRFATPRERRGVLRTRRRASRGDHRLPSREGARADPRPRPHAEGIAGAATRRRRQPEDLSRLAGSPGSMSSSPGCVTPTTSRAGGERLTAAGVPVSTRQDMEAIGSLLRQTAISRTS